MKKQNQLGMNPSTATGRLVKDLLFSYVKDQPCHVCGKALTRETFSIDHKVPWLDSEDPLALFFDLDNIAFSHKSCNYGARRSTYNHQCGTFGSYRAGCRCSKCATAGSEKNKRFYTSEARHERYIRNGK